MWGNHVPMSSTKKSRIVVGPGKYRIEGIPGNEVEVPGVPGLTLTDMWQTDGFPIDNSAETDLAFVGEFSVAPEENGTCFRVIQFPCKATMDRASSEALSSLSINSESLGDGLMWHQTNTIDYVTIVTGSIELVTEVDRTILRAGDVAIVRGVRHAWTNPGSEPCTMSCVSVGAK